MRRVPISLGMDPGVRRGDVVLAQQASTNARYSSRAWRATGPASSVRLS
jgi:hypothetical protein